MNNNAKLARKQYMQNYRKEHHEQISLKQKEWRKNNPDKVNKIIEKYWENKSKFNGSID